MLALISPAKRIATDLNLNQSKYSTLKFTPPSLHKHTQELISILKQLSIQDIMKLMGVSEAIAKLNYNRFQNFNNNNFIDDFTPATATPSLLTFEGDVYKHLSAPTLSTDQLEYANKHLGILSGLYGYLKPFDLIKPYRLEMGTKLANPHGTNLYKFWGDAITNQVNLHTQKHNISNVINLASNEYFSAIRPDKLHANLINIIFKQVKNNQEKIIGIMAKKARGLMSRFIIDTKPTSPLQLQKFNLDNYQFNPEKSTANQYIFIKQ